MRVRAKRDFSNIRLGFKGKGQEFDYDLDADPYRLRRFLEPVTAHSLHHMNKAQLLEVARREGVAEAAGKSGPVFVGEATNSQIAAAIEAKRAAAGAKDA